MTNCVKNNVKETFDNNFLEIEPNTYVYIENNDVLKDSRFKLCFPDGLDSIENLYSSIIDKDLVLSMMFDNYDYEGFMEVIKLSETELISNLTNNFDYDVYNEYLYKHLQFKFETIENPNYGNEKANIIVFNFSTVISNVELQSMFFYNEL